MLSATVSPTNDAVAVSVDDRAPVSLHAMWIRDACGCSACRSPTTNERLLDSAVIDPMITVNDVAIDTDEMRITLSDGHTSFLAVRWLTSHLAGFGLRGPAAAVLLSTSGSAAHVEEFERADLDQPAGLLAWLDAILGSGVAFLHGVTPDESGHRGVAELVGPIRATNYGATWEIAATVEPVSAVDSERHLFVHTDLPYRAEPPGVQLLLAAVVEVEGGASTLVDGFAAAERLRMIDADGWALLTRTEFTFPFIRDEVEIHGRAPLIGLAADGTYDQIRRAPDLVGVPIVIVEDTPALYAALGKWSEVLDDPAFCLSIPLLPGDLLAFDNHRMLHGRTAFELGASGRRRLLGCYLDLDDLRSRRAVTSRRVTERTEP